MTFNNPLGLFSEPKEEDLKKKYVEIIESVEESLGREEANKLRLALGYKVKPIENAEVDDGK